MSFSTSVRPFGPAHIISFNTPVLRVSVSTLGATLYEVHVYQPALKKWVQVVVHYPNYEEAVEDTASYAGATVGRFAGRIRHGTFTLDGKTYHVPKKGDHSVHGGVNAFDKQIWQYEILDKDQVVGVRLTRRSPDGENGFPADLDCVVTYSVPCTAPGSLRIDFKASVPDCSPADATIVNIFNHAYWNLNGLPNHDHSPDNKKDSVWTERPEPVYNHLLRLPADSLLIEGDRQAIPTGRLIVPPPPLDFRQRRRVGDDIEDVVTDRDPRGYDHPYAIAGWRPGMRAQLFNAEIMSPSTNITMNVFSNFPCVWVYTANNLKKEISGAAGERFARHGSFGMEPQFPPDCANHKEFYTAVARKGKPYHYSQTHVFTVAEAPNKL